MDRPKSEVPTILVTDTSRGSAISIIRSLGRRGWRVIAADSVPSSPGFRSRYVQDRLVYPAPEDAPGELVTALLNAAQVRQIDLMIPVTDAIVLPLSAARARFEGICKLAIPGASGLQVAANKYKTVELAKRLGVPVPQTVLVHTVQEACQQGQFMDWPVVLKPQVSHLYQGEAAGKAFKVCYAEHPDRLAEQMARFEGQCPVLLQEYYPGVGCGVELLLYQGQPLAAFQHKRLREVPLHGGASAFRESVPLDPALLDYSVRLLAALNWTGLAMVEFKVGRDGPKLMEINGRVWGSLPLAVHSGMDFPARLVELYLQGPPASPELDTDYTVGVRSRNLELDMLWIGSVLAGKKRYAFLTMPDRGQGLKALAGLFNPANKFDILTLEDLRPGLAEISKVARKLRGKLKEAA